MNPLKWFLGLFRKKVRAYVKESDLYSDKEKIRRLDIPKAKKVKVKPTIANCKKIWRNRHGKNK